MKSNTIYKMVLFLLMGSLVFAACSDPGAELDSKDDGVPELATATSFSYKTQGDEGDTEDRSSDEDQSYPRRDSELLRITFLISVPAGRRISFSSMATRCRG